MRFHSSAAWKKAGRVWSLSAALLLVVMFAWMLAAAAWPASGGPTGMEAAVSLSGHGGHHAMPEDCCGEVEAADCEPCVLASVCSVCAPLDSVLRSRENPGPECLAPEPAHRLAGLTVLPPDHPPRPSAQV